MVGTVRFIPAITFSMLVTKLQSGVDRNISILNTDSFFLIASCLSDKNAVIEKVRQKRRLFERPESEKIDPFKHFVQSNTLHVLITFAAR